MSGAFLSRHCNHPSCSWRQETRSKQIYLFTTRRKFPVYGVQRFALTLSGMIKCVLMYTSKGVSRDTTICSLVPREWIHSRGSCKRKRKSTIALPLFAHENDLCSLLYFLLLSSEKNHVYSGTLKAFFRYAFTMQPPVFQRIYVYI